jgi:hypothetical protein
MKYQIWAEKTVFEADPIYVRSTLGPFRIAHILSSLKQVGVKCPKKS